MDTHKDWLVKLENVSRMFKRGVEAVHALSDINLIIRRGDFLAVMGASGSGKSTLLNLIGILDRPTSGRIFFGKTSIERMTDQEISALRLHTIGFVFQSFHLISYLSAAENVAMPFCYSSIRQREAERRVDQALEKVGLMNRKRHKATELSGGEQQRIALARALVMQPELLLADEPTGNLDTASGQTILKIFQELNAGGHTIVLVTHDVSIASAAHNIRHLLDGKWK